MSQILQTSSPESCIGDKIEAMSKSMAQISYSAISIPMQTLKQMQKDREDIEFMIGKEQKGALTELGLMQNRLLTIDKENMLKTAAVNYAEDSMMSMVEETQEELIQLKQEEQQRQLEIRERVTNLKVGLTEKQQSCRYLLQQSERDITLRLATAKERIDAIQGGQRPQKVQAYMKSQFKSLRKEIEQEVALREKEEANMVKTMKDLKKLIQNSSEEEQLKQKDSFERSYSALEEVFGVLCGKFGLHF